MKVHLVDEPKTKRKTLPKRRYGKWLKPVRRVHMVTGVLLFPWVILYGVSGMLFNHPTLGEDIERRALTPEELERAGFVPRDPSALASRVVEQINAQSIEGGPYRLDPDFASTLSGFSVLLGEGEANRYLMIADAWRGRASVGIRPKVAGPPVAPFAGAEVSLEGDDLAAIEASLGGMVRELGIENVTLSSRARLAQELRFRVVDAEGHAYDAAYHLGRHDLEGKPTGGASGLTLSQALQRLHMTHHYPSRFGPGFLWAFFADLTGLTMALWALTGLVMEAVIKPARRLVVVSVCIALVMGSLVILGTYRDITWAEVASPSAPGDR